MYNLLRLSSSQAYIRKLAPFFRVQFQLIRLASFIVQIGLY